MPKLVQKTVCIVDKNFFVDVILKVQTIQYLLTIYTFAKDD